MTCVARCSRPLLTILCVFALFGCASADIDQANPDGAVNVGTDAGNDTSGPPVGQLDASPAVDAAPTDAAPDGGPTPTACTLAPNAGCPSGQSCDLDGAKLATGGTTCRDIVTAGTETSTCDLSTECAKGYVCLGEAGSCRRYCADDAECPGAGGLCTIKVVHGTPTMEVPGVTTCSSGCDPVTSSGCPAGFTCPIAGNDTDGYYSQCRKAGAGTQEAVCTDHSQCAPNFECLVLPGDDRCRRACLVDAATTGCENIPGTVCTGYNPAVTLGNSTTPEYGNCVTP